MHHNIALLAPHPGAPDPKTPTEPPDNTSQSGREQVQRARQRYQLAPQAEERRRGVGTPEGAQRAHGAKEQEPQASGPRVRFRIGNSRPAIHRPRSSAPPRAPPAPKPAPPSHHPSGEPIDKDEYMKRVMACVKDGTAGEVPAHQEKSCSMLRELRELGHQQEVTPEGSSTVPPRSWSQRAIFTEVHRMMVGELPSAQGVAHGAPMPLAPQVPEGSQSRKRRWGQQADVQYLQYPNRLNTRPQTLRDARLVDLSKPTVPSYSTPTYRSPPYRTPLSSQAGTSGFRATFPDGSPSLDDSGSRTRPPYGTPTYRTSPSSRSAPPPPEPIEDEKKRHRKDEQFESSFREMSQDFSLVQGEQLRKFYLNHHICLLSQHDRNVLDSVYKTSVGGEETFVRSTVKCDIATPVIREYFRRKQMEEKGPDTGTSDVLHAESGEASESVIEQSDVVPEEMDVEPGCAPTADSEQYESVMEQPVEIITLEDDDEEPQVSSANLVPVGANLLSTKAKSQPVAAGPLPSEVRPQPPEVITLLDEEPEPVGAGPGPATEPQLLGANPQLPEAITPIYDEPPPVGVDIWLIGDELQPVGAEPIPAEEPQAVGADQQSPEVITLLDEERKPVRANQLLSAESYEPTCGAQPQDTDSDPDEHSEVLQVQSNSEEHEARELEVHAHIPKDQTPEVEKRLHLDQKTEKLFHTFTQTFITTSDSIKEFMKESRAWFDLPKEQRQNYKAEFYSNPNCNTIPDAARYHLMWKQTTEDMLRRIFMDRQLEMLRKKELKALEQEYGSCLQDVEKFVEKTMNLRVPTAVIREYFRRKIS